MKNTDNEHIKTLEQLLENNSDDIVIITHENPDGDAIGSAVGLAEVLTNKGHLSTVITPTNYPEFLKWFSSDVDIIVYSNNKNRAKKAIAESGIIICVDFNEPKRSGNLQDYILKSYQPKVLIDHHPNPSQFCDYQFSETDYSSTAELIYDIIIKIGFKKYMNKNAAEALYTGIMTDTGSFSHNVSRANVFNVAGKLISYGINTDNIQSNVYHNFSTDRMKLLGYCLNEKMEVFPEYRAAVISISKKELKDFNFEPGDTEGFVNYPLSINNIVFSALFIEKDGYVKASFRSKGDFPANRFSSLYFNGGGHLNAAGGESKTTLDKTINMFKQLLEQYKNQLIDTKL